MIKTKRTISLFAIIIALLFPVMGFASSLTSFLEQLDIKELKPLKKESFYNEIYEIMIEQPLDHNNPEKGSFFQKIYVSHIDPNLPVVIVTEGYNSGYYYTSEPALLLKCNQILVEHRYFGDSRPDSIDYKYLNAYQSASDYHKIIQEFKKFYKSKWISTGISKGGQTTLLHSYYYPEDVDLRIPYVAPLNTGIEDERIYNFLDHVGSKKCRRRIFRFQKNALKNENRMMPEFINFSEAKNYTYDILGGMEKAYEYCVLEYSFAFWQWGYADCSDIPRFWSSPSDIVRHMNMVAGFDYFADQFIKQYQPFFYQSYTELGYYGYDLDKFKKYLNYADEPGFQFALPENTDINFNPELLKDLDNFVKNDAKNFIFIYGKNDTWSATAANAADNKNIRIFYKKGGSHRTRIRNMPEYQKEEVVQQINDWLSDDSGN